MKYFESLELSDHELSRIVALYLKDAVSYWQCKRGKEGGLFDVTERKLRVDGAMERVRQDDISASSMRAN